MKFMLNQEKTMEGKMRSAFLTKGDIKARHYMIYEKCNLAELDDKNKFLDAIENDLINHGYEFGYIKGCIENIKEAEEEFLKFKEKSSEVKAKVVKEESPVNNNSTIPEKPIVVENTIVEEEPKTVNPLDKVTVKKDTIPEVKTGYDIIKNLSKIEMDEEKNIFDFYGGDQNNQTTQELPIVQTDIETGIGLSFESASNILKNSGISDLWKNIKETYDCMINNVNPLVGGVVLGNLSKIGLEADENKLLQNKILPFTRKIFKGTSLDDEFVVSSLEDAVTFTALFNKLSIKDTIKIMKNITDFEGFKKELSCIIDDCLEYIYKDIIKLIDTKTMETINNLLKAWKNITFDQFKASVLMELAKSDPGKNTTKEKVVKEEVPVKQVMNYENCIPYTPNDPIFIAAPDVAYFGNSNPYYVVPDKEY